MLVLSEIFNDPLIVVRFPLITSSYECMYNVCMSQVIMTILLLYLLNPMGDFSFKFILDIENDGLCGCILNYFLYE